MGLLARFVFQAIALALQAVFFIFKITFTYFYKCFVEVCSSIKDEWKNREVDDEIYK